MTRIATLLLTSVTSLSVASTGAGAETFFRLVAPPSPPPVAIDTGGGAGAPPPAAGTNNGPQSGPPVLTLNGLDAASTRSSGAPVKANFSLANGVAPITYSVVSGTKPPELTVANDGTVSGTPRTAGRYAFVVRAVDANARPAEMSVNITVLPPVPEITVHMPSGPIFAGMRFAAPISVDNGVQVDSFSFFDGHAPFLSIVGNELRGAPQAGNAGFQEYGVQANDPYGQTGSSFGLFEVILPTLTLDGMPARVRAGAPFAGTLDSNVPDGTWSVSSTPAGVTGTVTGTALSASAAATTADVPYVVSVTQSRADGVTASATENVVAVPALAVTGGGAVTARVGRALASVPTPAASHLLDPSRKAAWSLAAGTLPSGITVDPATGALIGTAAAGTPGNYPGIAVTASDPSDATTASSQPFALKVLGELAFQGIPANVRLTKGYTYRGYPAFANHSTGIVTAANLPPGISPYQSGSTAYVDGTPNTLGTTVATFSATDPVDQASATGSVTYTVVDPVKATNASQTFRQNAQIDFTPTLTGTPPYVTSRTSGNFPVGVTLADAATLRHTGSAPQTGNFSSTYNITDAEGIKGFTTLQLAITAGPTTSAPTALKFRAGRTVTYPRSYTLDGFTSPTYTTNGTWPSWATLDAATGSITGSPVTGSPNASLGVRITDGVDKAYTNANVSASYVAGDLACYIPGQTGFSQAVTNNQAFTSGTPGCSNAIGAVTWAASPSLPTGLTMTSAGVLKSVTNTVTEWDGTLIATDAGDGQTYRAENAFFSAEPAMAIGAYKSGAAAVAGSQVTAGTAFTWSFDKATTGGLGPYRYELQANGNNDYGYVSNQIMTPPPFGAFDTATGTWSGVAALPAGKTTTSLTFSVRAIDSRGRITFASMGVTIKH